MSGHGGSRWRKRPWTPKRPLRWVDGGSSVRETDCFVTISNLSCVPGRGREMVVGDIDFAWADKAEVTLTRNVGSLDVYWTSASSGPAYAIPCFRWGLLLLEEIPGGVGPTAPIIDLFDPAQVADYEWLWLHQEIPPQVEIRESSPEVVFHGTIHVPFDIRVKRKAGQKDTLNLYSTFGIQSGASFYDVSAQQWVMNRTLLQI